jgi:hypothetical protein
MTEADWLTSTGLDAMLYHLRLKASKRDRKLRLFACALIRMFMWQFLTDERSRRVVEVSERYGDGMVTQEELVTARRAAQAASRSIEESQGGGGQRASWAAGLAAMVAPAKGAEAAHIWAAGAQFASGGLDATTKVRNRVDRRLCDVLRDLFGNPFRSAAVDPSWLTWNGSTVVTLAQGIYNELAFDRLPVLADALEDAGCDNADILNHCRQPGEHVRGCWVVDLLTGRS